MGTSWDGEVDGIRWMLWHEHYVMLVTELGKFGLAQLLINTVTAIGVVCSFCLEILSSSLQVQ